MKKTLIMLLIGSSLCLTGCQNHEEITKETHSKEENYIKTAMTLIDEGKYYQAKDKLEQVTNKDEVKKAQKIDKQIDTLLEIKKLINNDEQTKADEKAKTLINDSQTIAVIKDEANQMVKQSLKDKENTESDTSNSKTSHNEHSEKTIQKEENKVINTKSINDQIDEIVTDYNQQNNRQYQKMEDNDKPLTLGGLTLSELTNGNIKMIIDGEEIPLSKNTVPTNGYKLIAFYDEANASGAGCNSLLFCIDENENPEILQANGPGQAMMMITQHFDKDENLKEQFKEIME